MKKWTKKQRITLGIVILLVAGSGGVGYKVYADNQYKEQVTQALKQLEEKETTLEDLFKQVGSFSDNDYLNKDISLENWEKVVKAVEDFKLSKTDLTDEKVKKEQQKVEGFLTMTDGLLNKTQAQLDLQTAVNDLFAKDTAINGKEVKKDLAIKDDLKLTDIDALTDDLSTVTETGKLLPDEENKTKEVVLKESGWQKDIQAILKNATDQVNQINDLTKKVEGYYKDGKPKNDGKRVEVEKLQKEVAKIKNEKAKKQLSDKLKAVLKEIEKKEKSEAEKKAKESGGTVKQNDDGSYEVIAPQQQTTPSTNSYTENTGGGTNYGDNSYSNAGGSNGYTPQTGGNSYTPPASNGGSSTGSTGTGGSTGGSSEGNNVPPAQNGNNDYEGPNGNVITEENQNGGENNYWGWD